ncbi:hypothetical protein TWF970_006594 [Orbilia oligospora]|uniref:Uncharacterized protein n=1 Tax=Orbilia oligospora TaxID=2813651 RepID=A0A7C8R5P9_ORBOL|nr:hypothetical protein TWF970_006594 [Orbilia oligospora]
MAKLYGQTHSSRGSGSDYSRLYYSLDSSKLEDFQDYFGYEVRKLWRRVIKKLLSVELAAIVHVCTERIGTLPPSTPQCIHCIVITLI